MYPPRFAALALLIGLTAGAEVGAEPLEIGDLVLELETLEDMSQRLMLGGRVISADDRIHPGEQMALADGFVRVLNVGSGGSACSGGLQVLWAKGTEVTASEKTDPCLYPEVIHRGDALELRVKPQPALPGQGWRWTPATGLEPLEDKEFSPEPGQGWEAFAAFAESHPIDMLGFAPVYAQFKAEMSDEHFDTLAVTLNELGSGKSRPEGYVGEACAKWECDARFGHLWVDVAKRRAYAFWRADDQEFASPLPLESWPQWVVLDAAEKLAARE